MKKNLFKKLIASLFIIIIIIFIGITYFKSKSSKQDVDVNNTQNTQQKKELEEPATINKKVVNTEAKKKSVIKKEVKKIDPIEAVKKECKLKSTSKQEEYFCLAKSGLWSTEDKDILTISNVKGWSVAHILAQFNEKFNPSEDILYIVDNNQLSVAHVLAQFNKTWSTKNKDIQSLKNNAEESVAHFLVSANKIADITDEEVLNLTTSYGVSVRDLYKKRR